MDHINFQDSVYRTQPAEKMQARDHGAIADEKLIKQQEKEKDDQEKERIAKEAEEAEGKIVDQEKKDTNPDYKKKSKKKTKNLEKRNRKHPGAGESLIDVDA